jgi:hypothetical protein
MNKAECKNYIPKNCTCCFENVFDIFLRKSEIIVKGNISGISKNFLLGKLDDARLFYIMDMMSKRHIV